MLSLFIDICSWILSYFKHAENYFCSPYSEKFVVLYFSYAFKIENKNVKVCFGVLDTHTVHLFLFACLTVSLSFT